jgi:sodium transport system permease protein
MFALTLVLSFYGGILVERLGVLVTLLTIQYGFFLLPVLGAVLLFRFTPREALAWRTPSMRGLLAAVLVGTTAWMTASGFLLRLLPPPESLARAMEQILMLGSGEPAPLWKLWLVVAVTPAFCEELFFRGFVLSGFRRFGMWPAILISALLFGLAHSSVYRMLPTVALGVAFGYLVFKTGSIACGMIAHAVNNGIMVTLASSAPVRRSLGLSDTEAFLPIAHALAGTLVLLAALGLASRRTSRA